MRRSIAALALIERDRNGRNEWLAQWNSHWQRFHLVGGHKRGEESFRECVIREIEEELGLRDGVEISVAARPKAHLEFVAWAQTETAYTMELFEARFRGLAACEKVEANPQNRWLSEAEIRAGRCADGRPVSPTMRQLLAELNGSGASERPLDNDA
jgi:8-oxo-dGTP pyrophosphatase MutT (NUDIX family)